MANDYLDMSEHATDSPLHSLRNKAIPGYFKDDAVGKVIEEFVGLR